MTVELLFRVLAWCTAINYALLLLWGGLFLFARGWMRLQTRYFNIPPDQLDVIHFRGILQYKLLVFVLNLVPLIALWLSK